MKKNLLYIFIDLLVSLFGKMESTNGTRDVQGLLECGEITLEINIKNISESIIWMR